MLSTWFARSSSINYEVERDRVSDAFRRCCESVADGRQVTQPLGRCCVTSTVRAASCLRYRSMKASRSDWLGRYVYSEPDALCATYVRFKRLTETRRDRRAHEPCHCRGRVHRCRAGADRQSTGRAQTALWLRAVGCLEHSARTFGIEQTDVRLSDPLRYLLRVGHVLVLAMALRCAK